jgi:hypothetical protein
MTKPIDIHASLAGKQVEGTTGLHTRAVQEPKSLGLKPDVSCAAMPSLRRYFYGMLS